MNNSRRSRIRLSIGTESLESRNLMNAHLPLHPAAHVAALATTPAHTNFKAPHQLSGTVTGLSTYTTNPLNANQGYDTYVASTPTAHGVAKYIGTDSFTSTLSNPTTFNDTYFNGFTVLYLADGNNLSISYVGNGKSPASANGNYTASFKGEAIGIDGPLTGHVYHFTAKLTGNETTSAVSIKFSLKS
jgi:hypothetical protein